MSYLSSGTKKQIYNKQTLHKIHFSFFVCSVGISAGQILNNFEVHVTKHTGSGLQPLCQLQNTGKQSKSTM